MVVVPKVKPVDVEAEIGAVDLKVVALISGLVFSLTFNMGFPCETGELNVGKFGEVDVLEGDKSNLKPPSFLGLVAVSFNDVPKLFVDSKINPALLIGNDGTVLLCVCKVGS